MLSQTARRKLALVIGQIIGRSIEEARNIPFVLENDEVIDILVRDPDRFNSLINQEQVGKAQFSTGTLTDQLDAVAELGQLEVLDGYDMSFGETNSSEEDLKPAVNLIHHLTRLFAVYLGNTVTLFEKEFDTFVSKLNSSIQSGDRSLEQVRLDPDDMLEIEHIADKYLDFGKYMQAFLVDRLLSMHVVSKKLISLPQGYSLATKLVERLCHREEAAHPFLTFVLRASYVSQGGWEDYLVAAVRYSIQHPSWRSVLIGAIERDAIFCCNFLRDSFGNLKHLSSAELHQRIEAELRDRIPFPNLTG
jgi:hypothetical protein